VLSDHEREVWRELERQFTTEQGRATTDDRPSRARRPLEATATLLIMTMVFLAVIMLLAGSLMGVLIFGGAAWLIWWSWPSAKDGTQQPP
jgi:ferric-dicitrate binding protein FerR (iron transport regulator)